MLICTPVVIMEVDHIKKKVNFTRNFNIMVIGLGMKSNKSNFNYEFASRKLKR